MVANLAALVAVILTQELQIDWIVLPTLCVLIAAGPVFYVTLGMLAARLGYSWITWVGLAFITAPVGPFVAWGMMSQRVRRRVRSATA
jgi:hypothetical protein